MKTLLFVFSILFSVLTFAGDRSNTNTNACVSVYTRSGSEIELCSNINKEQPTTIYKVSFKTDKGSLELSTKNTYTGVDPTTLNDIIKITALNGFSEYQMSYVLGTGKRLVEKVSTGLITEEEATLKFALFFSES